MGQQIVNPLAGERAYGDDRMPGHDLTVMVDQRQQLSFVAHQVDLVDDQDHRCPHLLETVHHELGGFPVSFERVHEETDDIDLGQRCQSSIHHDLVEFVLRFHDPRSVDKHHLQVRFIENAEQTIAGGLGPRGGDR